MNEMKFLLVGTPSKDSVWLHLDTSGRAGISLWRNGRLSNFEHPAFWLADHLWLIKATPVSGQELALTGPQLEGLLKYALQDAICAICQKDHALLAQSMCTIYSYQFINGAPMINFSVRGTLGRMMAIEFYSSQPYLMGITKRPVRKAVLK